MGGGILVLLAVAAVVWAAALREDRHGQMSVSFLNAGKSDVVLINAPSGRKVLIDGGSDASVLRSLASVSPWYDRSIDVVIAAHPDAAHTTGLVDILNRFNVAYVFRASVRGSDPASLALDRALADAQKKGTLVKVAQRGEVINLGKGTWIEILFPDRDLSGAPTSGGCIEMRLVYGATSFMLSCGNPAVEDYLVRLDGAALHSDVLSENDGASATGSTSSPQASSELFAGFVGAQYMAQSGMTLVSDGKTVSLK